MSVFGLNAGDIMLTNSNTWYNLLGQKISRELRPVNTTHVALSLGEGMFIHADDSCGVELVFLSDLVDKNDGNWRVIRYADAKGDFEEVIRKKGVFHLNKSYSYRYVLKENQKSLFCSQFVDVVFRSAGVNIFNQKKREASFLYTNAFPVDFESLLSDEEKWTEVTDVYQGVLNEGFISHLKIHFNTSSALIYMYRNARQRHENLQVVIKYMNDSHNLLPEEYQSAELREQLSGVLNKLSDDEDDFFYEFWNIRTTRDIK